MSPGVTQAGGCVCPTRTPEALFHVRKPAGFDKAILPMHIFFKAIVTHTLASTGNHSGPRILISCALQHSTT